MTKDINLMHSVRANPFDVSRPMSESANSATPPETSLMYDEQNVTGQRILLDDDELASIPSPSEEPTFHLAALAAQLYSIDAREQHIEKVITTSRLDESPSDDEDDDAESPSKHFSAYSSMQICFVSGNSEEMCQEVAADIETETASGRESRGAADGASTGTPAAQEELEGDFEQIVSQRLIFGWRLTVGISSGQ